MTTVVTGYYGSGKTEFCVNLALQIAGQGNSVTIADLDVSNPYFRSREAARGPSPAFGDCPRITVISDHFGGNTGQDIPATSYAFLPKIRAGEDVILDLAGGKTGIRLLANCYEAIQSAKYEFLCVLNLFRPETNSPEKMIDFVQSINQISQVRITGLVNNGNLLHETTPDHILASQSAILAAAAKLNLPLRHTLISKDLYNQIPDMIQSDNILTFDKLKMREPWQ